MEFLEFADTGKRRTTVYESERQFRSYVLGPNGFEIEDIGTVNADQYNKEKDISVFSFKNTANDKVSKMGYGKTGIQIVDHVDMISPILDRGFEIERATSIHNGITSFFLLSHPEYKYADTIAWDKSLYSDEVNNVNLAIGVWASGAVGKAIRYVAGFFRSICTNGLISQHLNFGDVKYNHRTISSGKIDTFVDDMVAKHKARAFTTKLYPAEAINWPLGIMYEAINSTDAVANLPAFCEAPLTTFGRLPLFVRRSLIEQLDLMSTDKNEFTQVDLVNAYTNVANTKSGKGSGENSIYFNMEAMFGALTEMVEIGAFKAGVEPKIIEMPQ